MASVLRPLIFHRRRWIWQGSNVWVNHLSGIVLPYSSKVGSEIRLQNGKLVYQWRQVTPKQNHNLGNLEEFVSWCCQWRTMSFLEVPLSDFPTNLSIRTPTGLHCGRGASKNPWSDHCADCRCPEMGHHETCSIFFWWKKKGREETWTYNLYILIPLPLFGAAMWIEIWNNI